MRICIGMKGYTVQPIKREDAIPWIMRKHYAKRVPSICHAFGLFKDNLIQGICTFGLPPSPHLCKGICGAEYRDIVLEFNRLCLEAEKNTASFLIGRALKLIPTPKILVSYADTAQNHIGYVYQSTNWIYTGLNNDIGRKNPRRYRISTIDQKKHDRHISSSDNDSELVSIPLKHRYVYFLGSKKQKKEMLKALNYPILPYPKGESKRYDTSATFPKQVQMF